MTVMTPPGLTCTRCDRPLYPKLARRDNEADGWRHVGRCPRVCSLPDCERTYLAAGYCRRHYHQHVEGRTPRDTFDQAAFLEDVEWMADTGETWTGAIQRLKLKADTFERRLERLGRRDLIQRLRGREVAA